MSTIINQKARSLLEGLNIVRNILKSNPFPNGFTTSQLFQVAVQQPPPPDFPVYRHTSAPPKIKKDRDRFRKVKIMVPGVPSHPEHPIRSVRFLKAEVLPLLAQKNEIKKVRQKCLTPVDPVDPVNETEKVKKGKGSDSGYEFVWKVVGPGEVPPPPRLKPKKEVVGEEVGVNADYGHLNNRRQNARVGKITRDVETMKTFRQAFRQDETTARDRVGKSFRYDQDRDQTMRRDRQDNWETKGRDRFARNSRDYEAYGRT